MEWIAPARTFGFAKDIDYLRQKGLAQGGNFLNAVVVSDRHTLNPGGLRWHDEMVRHKVLDAIGDLYLLGHPLLTHYTGHKCGHALNNRLLHALLADANNYRWQTLDANDAIACNQPPPNDSLSSQQDLTLDYKQRIRNDWI